MAPKKANAKDSDPDYATELSDSGDESDLPIPFPSSSKSRHLYTTEEDINMLKYILNEGSLMPIHGLELYRNMEQFKVTKHSAASMNGRIRRVVLPNIHKYKIPNVWKERLKPYSPRKDLIRKDKESSAKEDNHQTDSDSMDIYEYTSEDEFDRNLAKRTKENKKSNPSSSTPFTKIDFNDKNKQSSISRTDNVNDKQKFIHNDDDSSDGELDSSFIYRNEEEINDGRESAKRWPKRKGKNYSPKKPSADNIQQTNGKLKTSKEQPPQKLKESRVSYIVDDDDVSEESATDSEVVIMSEVDKLQRTLSGLGEAYGLLEDEVFYLLNRHDGSVKETIKFIETGKSKMTWDPADDEDLKKNTGSKRLINKYSEIRVTKRTAFLEGL